MADLRVTGIDPALEKSGLATWAAGWHTELMVTKPPKPGAGRPSEVTWARYTRIRKAVLDHVWEHDSHLVVIEAPLWHAVTRGSHIADRAGLWWLIWQDLHHDGRAIAVVNTTSREKYATGVGNAGKERTMAAAIRRYLDAPILNNNVADAVLLAAMGARWLGEPVEADLPARNLEAMAVVDWPAHGRLSAPT